MHISTQISCGIFFLPAIIEPSNYWSLKKYRTAPLYLVGVIKLWFWRFSISCCIMKCDKLASCENLWFIYRCLSTRHCLRLFVAKKNVLPSLSHKMTSKGNKANPERIMNHHSKSWRKLTDHFKITISRRKTNANTEGLICLILEKSRWFLIVFNGSNNNYDDDDKCDYSYVLKITIRKSLF